MGDITQLIDALQAGQPGAADRLMAALYDDLRRIAHARLAGHQRHTLLDTTALVHECYLKLVHSQRLRPDGRGAFLAYAARTMRSIIVDHARQRLAERRGGGQQAVTLDTQMSEQLAQPEQEILDVHGALAQLAELSPRLAQVVEMRYFGGLSEDQIAEALGLTSRTVRRDWLKARALLAAALGV